MPPADWPLGKKWLLSFEAGDGSMVGMADVISDLLVKDVWHIGLFIVSTRLHGGGVAHELYGGLEDWMMARGARWSRLASSWATRGRSASGSASATRSARAPRRRDGQAHQRHPRDDEAAHGRQRGRLPGARRSRSARTP
jgi:hypothetical protein